MAPDDQITLFSFYNSLKESGESRLLMAGRQPPMALAVRDDLRTRLGWGLVFEVKALSDEDKNWPRCAATPPAVSCRSRTMSTATC
ncbi:hypothetical protein JOS77_19620 [Chromobacterium haemolyticum]|nr:hypothetical protein JOS77_19620 [Chromobacterium haemolyticum]